MLHLIHPVFVHFAVALLFTGGLCEAGGIFARRPGVERFGGTLVILGTLVLVPTVATGYLAANSLSVAPLAVETLDAHERNGLILLAVFLIALVWKGWNRGEIPRDQRLFYAVWICGGVVVAGYSAYLGGELVYGHGVGVAPGG